MNAGILKNRVEVFEKAQTENEFGQMSYTYNRLGFIWAEILPTRGGIEKMEGETIRTNITHKIIVRRNAIKEPHNEMYFIYRGQKYDVQYFMFHYQKNHTIEFYCKLTIEGDEDYERQEDCYSEGTD